MATLSSRRRQGTDEARRAQGAKSEIVTAPRVRYGEPMLETRTLTTSAGLPLLTRTRHVDLGLPKSARSGYGSAVAGERDKLAFYVSYSDYGWFLARFDLTAGIPRVLRGLGSELRDSLFDPVRGTWHLATTRALCELDPESFTILRRMKLRGFPNRLVPTPDPDVVLVSWGDKAFGIAGPTTVGWW